MPALDAVMFLTPRGSQVDVVQSVGRVMRKAPGKELGYIILPVVVPSGVAPEEALQRQRALPGRLAGAPGAALPRRPLPRDGQPDRAEQAQAPSG